MVCDISTFGKYCRTHSKHIRSSDHRNVESDASTAGQPRPILMPDNSLSSIMHNIELVTDPPIFSDTNAINVHPFLTMPLRDFSRSNIPNMPQNNAVHQQTAVLHLSSMKICCLRGRFEHFDRLCLEHHSSVDIPAGEYYKAVKIGSFGGTITMQVGRRYLCVMPMSSPVTTYYRSIQSDMRRSYPRQAHSQIAPTNMNDVTIQLDADTGYVQTASTSSSVGKRKRIESAQPEQSVPNAKKQKFQNESCLSSIGNGAYEFEEFQMQMLAEESDDGKCGLYELHEITAPRLPLIRALQKRRNTFCLFIPMPNLASYNSFKNDEPTCQCEVVKFKSVVSREIVAKVMSSDIKKLSAPLHSKSVSNQSSSRWSFINNLMNIWHKSKKNDLFADATSNSRDHKDMDDYLIENILTTRLRLLCSWSLIDQNKLLLNPPERCITTIEGPTGILRGLTKPSQSLYELTALLDKSSDTFLLGSDVSSEIIRELEKRLESISIEIAQSSARIRLLQAVFDVLGMMQTMAERTDENSHTSSNNSVANIEATSSHNENHQNSEEQRNSTLTDRASIEPEVRETQTRWTNQQSQSINELATENVLLKSMLQVQFCLKTTISSLKRAVTESQRIFEKLSSWTAKKTQFDTGVS